MTEFAFAVPTNEFLNSLQGRIETYLTGLFAMIVTSYFVAPRLSRAMSAMLIALFSLYCTVLGYATITALWRVGVLARRVTASPVADFPWILQVPWFNARIHIVTLLAASYIGAIRFFLRARKRPLVVAT